MKPAFHTLYHVDTDCNRNAHAVTFYSFVVQMSLKNKMSSRKKLDQVYVNNTTKMLIPLQNIYSQIRLYAVYEFDLI